MSNDHYEQSTLDTSESSRAFGFGEWMQEFRPMWGRWTARLAVLQPEDAEEVEKTLEDLKTLAQLLQAFQLKAVGGTAYCMLWEQAFR